MFDSFPAHTAHILSIIFVFPYDYHILHIDDYVFPDLLLNLYSNYTILHKLSSNMQAGRMASSGRYSQIGLNKALKTMGRNGGLQRHDVIGIGKNGTSKLVEVVSL